MIDASLVPKATLQRYPVYLKVLRNLKKEGYLRVQSKELSEFTDIQATTIRRDFSFLGNLGKQGYGYDVDYLIGQFEQVLGVNFDEKIILVGIGNLGRALLNYNRWSHVVGRIVCGFDIDPEVIDPEAEFPVYDLKDLSEKIPHGCRLAILTASRNQQETVDKLIECGIIGIIDFTHGHFKVPKSVTVRTIDVVSAIQELVFAINFQKKV